jgi:malonyl-CoA O-methyltransferase
MPETGRVAAAFHQKAVEYDQHVLVQKRVVTQLVGSVERHVQRSPAHILDVGTGTGALLERLHAHYPAARLAGVDIAFNMCRQAQHKLGKACCFVNGDAEYLPFKSGTFDLVVSASALQWVSDLSAVLREFQRVVRPGGDISLAFFCEGSLDELRSCFQDAAFRRGSDGGRRTSRLHNFHAVGAVTEMAAKLDFERVVVNVETEVDLYDDLNSLLRSIKNIGAGSVTGGSGSGLGWRGILQETSRLYQERFGRNGKIPVTYKVLYLTARAKG